VILKNLNECKKLTDFKKPTQKNSKNYSKNFFSGERTAQTSSLIFNLIVSPQCLRLLKNFKFLAFKEKQTKSKSLFFDLQTMFE